MSKTRVYKGLASGNDTKSERLDAGNSKFGFRPFRNSYKKAPYSRLWWPRLGNREKGTNYRTGKSSLGFQSPFKVAPEGPSPILQTITKAQPFIGLAFVMVRAWKFYKKINPAREMRFGFSF